MYQLQWQVVDIEYVYFDQVVTLAKKCAWAEARASPCARLKFSHFSFFPVHRILNALHRKKFPTSIFFTRDPMFFF